MDDPIATLIFMSTTVVKYQKLIIIDVINLRWFVSISVDPRIVKISIDSMLIKVGKKLEKFNHL